MDARTELTRFLKARRALLQPEQVGLAGYGAVRRVAGLRREELARLAGVSVTHYTRLEQGQAGSVSTAVLDAVGTALRLDEAAQEYLANLVHPPRPLPADPAPAGVRTDLGCLLEGLVEIPALVTDARGALLRANAAFLRWFAGVRVAGRTWSDLLLFDGPFRAALSSPDALIRQDAAHLRLLWSRRPGDAVLGALLARLVAGSAEFRAAWSLGPVASRAPLRASFDGVLLAVEFLQPAGEPAQWLVTASPGNVVPAD